jgi:hypothetical protein
MVCRQVPAVYVVDLFVEDGSSIPDLVMVCRQVPAVYVVDLFVEDESAPFLKSHGIYRVKLSSFTAHNFQRAQKHP